MADRIKNYQQEADQITTLKAIRTDLGVTPSSYTPDATVVTKDRVVTFAQAEEELVVLSDIEKGVKQQIVDVDITQKDIANIKALLQGHLYDYQTDSTSAYTKSVPAGAMPYAGLEQIGGKTVVFNQSVRADRADGHTTSSNGVTYTWSDGGFTITANGTAQGGTSAVVVGQYTPCIAGHKYLIRGCPAQSGQDFFLTCSQLNITQDASQYYDYGNGSIFPVLSDIATASYIIARVNNGTTVNNVRFKPQFFDLTLMFGAGNEPTLEQCKDMFPAEWYPYSAPTLLSAGVTSVVSKGANLIPTYTTSGSSNGLTWTVSEDGSITINGTATDGTPIFAPISSWQWDGRTPCWLSGCPNGGSTNSYFLTIYGEDEWGAYQISENDTGNGVILQPKSGFDISNIPLRFRIVIISGTQCNNLTFKPILNYGTSAATYAPYIGTISTYSIPASIQALEGYGWSAGSAYNYVDFERKMFVKNVGSRAYASGDESDSTVVTDMTTTYYPLTTAVETDISEYLTDDNLINVEAGGTLTFPNQNGDDYRLPVPSEETYMIDLQEAINNG